MKKIVAFFFAMTICLSLGACGSNEEPAPTLSEADQVAVELAKDAVQYLEDIVIYPESFKLASVSYANSSTDETYLKITYSAKNDYGGEIDTSAYFIYSTSEQVFSDLFDAQLSLAAVSGAKDMLENGMNTDPTAIISNESLANALQWAESYYEIFADDAVDLDISYLQ